MRMLNGFLLAAFAAIVGCATSSTLSKESDTNGILRVTNYTRESVQVFLTTPNGDAFLRLIQPGNSESFHVPGKLVGIDHGSPAKKNVCGGLTPIRWQKKWKGGAARCLCSL